MKITRKPWLVAGGAVALAMATSACATVHCEPLTVYSKPGTTQERIFLAKPDRVGCGIVGDIIASFEKRGFTMVDEMAAAHYADL